MAGSSWLKKCDKIFSELIKYRDGWKCVETGTMEHLQTAHLISRSYHSVRWDPENAVCLSARRHMWYTYHPIEWREFCIKRLGQEKYEALEKRATQQSGAVDHKKLYAELTDKLEALRTLSR